MIKIQHIYKQGLDEDWRIATVFLDINTIVTSALFPMLFGWKEYAPISVVTAIVLITAFLKARKQMNLSFDIKTLSSYSAINLLVLGVSLFLFGVKA